MSQQSHRVGEAPWRGKAYALPSGRATVLASGAVHHGVMLDQRGRLLRAALGFLELRPAPQDTALIALRSWLNSWTGIGAVATGMAHQDYDLQLTRYDARGWRATF